MAKCALTGCTNPARPAMPGCVLQDQVDTLNPRSNTLDVQRSERSIFCVSFAARCRIDSSSTGSASG